MSQLQIEPTAAAVAEQVADLLLEALSSGRPLGLATGRTMEPVYRALLHRLETLQPQPRRALLQGWCSFNLDEYVGLSASDSRSFAATMVQALAAPLALAAGQLQLPDGRAADPAAEARRYAAALQQAGGLGLQLLGLGANGHVGFNEPPCLPEAPCRCVALSPATCQQNAAAFGGDPEAVPNRAITLGLAEILAADQLLLVVTGEAKAQILRQALEEPPCAEVPASWLQWHRRLRVVADAAAASALSLRPGPLPSAPHRPPGWR